MNQTESKSNSIFNKVFFIIFFLLIIASVAMTYVRIVVQKNYQIVAETSCDPTFENCFVRECDPEAEECSLIPEENISYYKLVSKKAATIAICEDTGDKIGCNEELSCIVDEFGDINEQDCSYEYCSEENVPEGESCSFIQ